MMQRVGGRSTANAFLRPAVPDFRSHRDIAAGERIDDVIEHFRAPGVTQD